MFKYTLIAIILAILLWLFGMGEYSLLVASLILLVGLISGNRKNLTSKDSVLSMVAMVGFILLTIGLFGDMGTTSSILITIFVILILSWIWAAANEEYGQVIILIIILIIFMVLAPILNAWVPIAGNAAQNVNTQLGMGEKTEGTFSAISDGIANIWLMLTDPTKWAEEKDAKKGKQEGDALALEITSVKAMPTTSMPNGEYSMMFEIKNLGENDATNVFVGARLDERALTHGSYIIDDTKEDEPTSWLYRSVDDVHPGEQRFESFDVVAPKCSGTFKTTAYVEYSYNAIAITNLEVINRDYYDDLLKHNKLQFKDQLSTSSAGPFKLTIRTQYPQPIPITKADGTTLNKFNIYFNAINEREGQAFIKSITFELPEGIIVPEGSGEDCELEPVVDENGITRYYITEDVKKEKNMCVGPNDMTSLKCVFAYDKDEGGAFEQEKTLFLKTAINYTFTYKKSTTTTVKSNVVGFETCSEIEKAESDISYETVLTVHETKLKTQSDAIFAAACNNYDPDNTPKTCTMDSFDNDKIVDLVDQLETACHDIWGSYSAYVMDGVSKECTSFTLNVGGVTCGGGNEVSLPQIVSAAEADEETNTKEINVEINNIITISYVQSSCTLSGVNLVAKPTGPSTCTDAESE